MNPRLIFGLFLAVSAAQLAVPVSQIWEHEDILRTGAVYRFRTAPVDPYDAFRGRYVALNYSNTVAEVRKGEELKHRALAYVTLHNDEAGFAVFGEITVKPPAEGDYLRVKCFYPGAKSISHARFRLPFDRFYMEETKAPRAQAAYFRHGNRRGQKVGSTYVIVRVKGGRGVIEDLYIKDKPIREFLEEEAMAQ